MAEVIMETLEQVLDRWTEKYYVTDSECNIVRQTITAAKDHEKDGLLMGLEERFEKRYQNIRTYQAEIVTFVEQFPYLDDQFYQQLETKRAALKQSLGLPDEFTDPKLIVEQYQACLDRYQQTVSHLLQSQQSLDFTDTDRQKLEAEREDLDLTPEVAHRIEQDLIARQRQENPQLLHPAIVNDQSVPSQPALDPQSQPMTPPSIPNPVGESILEQQRLEQQQLEQQRLEQQRLEQQRLEYRSILAKYVANNHSFPGSEFRKALRQGQGLDEFQVGDIDEEVRNQFIAASTPPPPAIVSPEPSNQQSTPGQQKSPQDFSKLVASGLAVVGLVGIGVGAIAIVPRLSTSESYVAALENSASWVNNLTATVVDGIEKEAIAQARQVLGKDSQTFSELAAALNSLSLIASGGPNSQEAKTLTVELCKSSQAKVTQAFSQGKLDDIKNAIGDFNTCSQLQKTWATQQKTWQNNENYLRNAQAFLDKKNWEGSIAEAKRVSGNKSQETRAATIRRDAENSRPKPPPLVVDPPPQTGPSIPITQPPTTGSTTAPAPALGPGPATCGEHPLPPC